jgi:hypothetical protein
MQGQNDAVLVKSFPPKRPTRRRFGDHFPPKSPTRYCFGDHFPPKSPTRRHFGDRVSHLGKTLDRPILFLFFFSFLFMNNLNINKWVGSFKTNSSFAYFNLIKKIGLVGQLVSGFRWANGFGIFLQPLTLIYKILSN